MADKQEQGSDSQSEQIRLNNQHKNDLQLDQAKLSAAIASEQGDVFILQWASKVEKTLKLIDPVVLTSVHTSLEASILKLVSTNIASSPSTPTTPSSSTSTSPTPTSSSTIPKPGRPLRQILSRILISIFQKTDNKSLFDTLQSLMRTVNSDDSSSSKSTPSPSLIVSKEAKISSLYLIGEIFGHLGRDVMSLFNEINSLCLKIFKNEKFNVILRWNSLITLRKSLEIGGRSLNDLPGKEILKGLKSGLGDKAGSVVRGSSECILVLLSQTNLLSTRAEIESILQIAFKSLENSDFVTKRSISKMSAGLLASTQVENSAPIPVPNKKNAKKKPKTGTAGGVGDEDSEEEEVAAQQAAAKAASISDENFRTLLSPKEMLIVLSNIILKKDSTRKLRLGILDIYNELFEVLGSKWCLIHYSIIVSHLFDYLPKQFKNSNYFSKHEFFILKKGISIILRDLIGSKMLTESAQIIAIQELTDLYLKKYPILTPGLQPASEISLALSLDEVSGLLIQLGSIPIQIFECLYDPLIRLLSHPKNSVQISSAWCLKVFCETNPTFLSKTIEKLLESIKKDIKVLNSGNKGNGIGNELPKRIIGNSRGLASLLNLIPKKPLYSSFEVSSQIMDLAIDLLKNSGDHELSVSAIEIQVSWTLIGSLVTLGPNFVRIHLTQLFNLWRVALPKPSTKDESGSSRSSSEWSFLLSIKESALTGLLSFLNHSSELLTLDTSRRIISLLTNTLNFLILFSNQHPTLSSEYSPGEERANLNLLDRENLLKRRIFQCFCKFKNSSNFDHLPQKELIELSISNFGHPDRYIGSSVQASIIASSGNFKSIWDLEDGYSFGLSSLVRDEEVFISNDLDPDDMNYSATTDVSRKNYKNRDLIENKLDCLNRRPILGSMENDPLVIYSAKTQRNDSIILNPNQDEEEVGEGREGNSSAPLPPPVLTGVVDAAIQLFSSLIQFQDRDFQIKIFETLLSFTRSVKLEKNPGRKIAIQMNILIAILGVLRSSSKGIVGPNGKKPSGFNNERLSTTLKEIIKDGLLNEDVNLRSLSAESFGRLAAVAGSHSMSSQVQFLVDQVVSNRDPNVRAGCVLAFGEIYEKIGGLSAGPLTKTIVNILISLSNDPNPIVHYYSLEALKKVIDSASLSYSPYVPSTLGMLVRLYFNETHEPDGGTIGSVTLKSDYKAYLSINKVINSIIGVLGPDLKDEVKIRELILILLKEFSVEDDDGVIVESVKSLQHFSLFTDHEFLELNPWIEQLRTLMRSNKSPLRIVSVNAFYQLVQREAMNLSRIGGDALVEELFGIMNTENQIQGLKETLLSWLKQTADKSPIGWIDLCQRIITGSSPKLNPNSTNQNPTGEKRKNNDLQDEESATLDLGDNSLKENSDSIRWRTQLFALKCLHEVFETLKRSGKFHLFVSNSSSDSQDQNENARKNLLTSKVSDLIKMAFTASTSPILRIRLEGLIILKDVVENFKNERDLDFQEAMLLEQHQAPITAALTPAFTIDSTPEVLASAVQVCATFVGSGTVREVEKMGRILKLLVGALEACMNSSMTQLGDVRDLSPNAAAMLKISVFKSWAELQVSSLQQTYLIEVIKPHLSDLVPFWISCLKEYAKIDTDPETAGLSSGGPGPIVNEILESEYAASAREVVLPYYQNSWLEILNAVSSLMDSDSRIVEQAMNGESTKDASKSENKKSQSEPSLFFFVLYGLAFQALSSSTTSTINSVNSNHLGQNNGSQSKTVALKALKSLIDQKFSGNSLLKEVGLFDELFNLAFRLVITEEVSVKIKVLDLIVGLVESHGYKLLDSDESEDSLPNNAKLTKCLRIITYVLTQARTLSQAGSLEEKATLIRTAYDAYCRVIKFYSVTVQEELFVVAFFSYSEMLRDETSEVDLVGPTLSSLKELCERAPQAMKANSEVLPKAIHGFMSAALQNVDDMRTRAGRIAENKTKNSLLASTVVLTSLPPQIVLSKSVIEYLCFLLSQKALLSIPTDSSINGNAPESVIQTSLFCIRSLLLASSRASPAVLYSVGQLLPTMVQLVVDVSNSLRKEDQEEKELDRNDSRIVALEETLKAFVSLVSVVGEDHRARFSAILLPTFILLLDPTSTSAISNHLHSVSVNHLLSLASSQQSAFRQATASLDSERKSILETSIRNAISSKTSSSQNSQKSSVGGMNLRDARQKEGISLRSFG